MTSPKIHSQKQSGQAIVLIAVLMTALIGALGLAIDGGGMYLLYRDAQNAVDAAALTSAFALCTGGDPEEAGLRTLEINGFDAARPDATVQVNNPPTQTNNVSLRNDSHVEIIINAVKPSYFIQVVYGGPLVVNVSAVSRCSQGTEGNVSNDQQYAFRSLADPNECNGSAAWRIEGTNLTIEGDVWMPNIDGRDGFNTRPGPPRNPGNPNVFVDNNNIDILGEIYVGGSQPPGAHLGWDNGPKYLLAEDEPDSDAGRVIPNYLGYGGDTIIHYGPVDAPEPDPLPYTMDFFRPAHMCNAGSSPDCGQLYNRYHTNDPATNRYYDLSDPSLCDHGALNHQDYSNNSLYVGTLYDETTNTWNDGIYYTGCNVTFNNSVGMNGNVSWISESYFNFNSSDYDLEPFEDDIPVIVSNHSSGNSAICSVAGTPANAIYFNANDSHIRGVIVAFNGSIEIGGNGYNFETCINSRGVYLNGNTDSFYQCVPGGTTSTQSEISIVE